LRSLRSRRIPISMNLREKSLFYGALAPRDRA